MLSAGRLLQPEWEVNDEDELHCFGGQGNREGMGMGDGGWMGKRIVMHTRMTLVSQLALSLIQLNVYHAIPILHHRYHYHHLIDLWIV
jgi:hypothetical protein